MFPTLCRCYPHPFGAWRHKSFFFSAPCPFSSWAASYSSPKYSQIRAWLNLFSPYLQPYLYIAISFIPQYNICVKKVLFDWDEEKDRENREKHNVSFSAAQRAFLDPHRIIVEDISHSTDEDRFYCISRVGYGIMTVRFTYRENTIRIYGAGYWRKGRKIYEEQNKIYWRANG